MSEVRDAGQVIAVAIGSEARAIKEGLNSIARSILIASCIQAATVDGALNATLYKVLVQEVKWTKDI